MPDHVGERVGQHYGNYRITRMLGKGGFAEVYEGEHVYLNTKAAIKILRTQLSQNEQGDFLTEARTIAHLVHPNIVRVLDFGMQNDTPFLVMDYAPNGSLRERHPKGSILNPETVVSYVKQMASALQYAHDEKLVHRDVKPENMLIGRGGEILLSDFGISSVVQTTQAQQTQEVVGTVPYMSPEQLQGKPRPATDQYALGIITYEWLSGTRPFNGGFTEMYGQHLFTEPPPLLERNPNIPREMAHVVHVALAKDPHQRFGNIRAFANALEQAYISGTGQLQTQRSIPEPFTQNSVAQTIYAQNTPGATTMGQRTSTYQDLTTPASDGHTQPQTPPVSPRPQAQTKISRRAALIGLAGATGVIATGGIWFVTRPQLPPTKTIISYTKHKEDDSVNAVAWSPDGNYIVSGGEDKTVQVWDPKKPEQAPTFVFRNHTETIKALAWSPDGKRIASAGADYTVYVWEPFDDFWKGTQQGRITVTYKGHPKKEFGGSGVYKLAWSPDGKHIASVSDNGEVHVWEPSEEGSKKPFIYDKQKESGPFAGTINSIAWSPDSKEIVSSGNGSVNLWNSADGAVRFENKDIYSADYLAWSADGQKIASGTSNTITIWDKTAGATIIKEIKDNEGSIQAMSWSPNNEYIATANMYGKVNIWKLALTDKKATLAQTYQLIGKEESSNDLLSVAWASDNRRLAVGSEKGLVTIIVAVD